MRSSSALILPFFAPMMLGGCAVAETAANIVMAPVHVVSKGADLLTTSEEEEDRNRGKAMRERDEKLGRLYEERDAYSYDCVERRDMDACNAMRVIDSEIARVRSETLDY